MCVGNWAIPWQQIRPGPCLQSSYGLRKKKYKQLPNFILFKKVFQFPPTNSSFLLDFIWSECSTGATMRNAQHSFPWSLSVSLVLSLPICMPLCLFGKADKHAFRSLFTHAVIHSIIHSTIWSNLSREITRVWAPVASVSFSQVRSLFLKACLINRPEVHNK